MTYITLQTKVTYIETDTNAFYQIVTNRGDNGFIINFSSTFLNQLETYFKIKTIKNQYHKIWNFARCCGKHYDRIAIVLQDINYLILYTHFK